MFFKYYNNNYRPIYHFENFILYLMFVVYVFVAVIYWNLVGECPFSINEKQLLNKKYVNGKTKI